jgi:hypothetical protein
LSCQTPGVSTVSRRFDRQLDAIAEGNFRHEPGGGLAVAVITPRSAPGC